MLPDNQTFNKNKNEIIVSIIINNIHLNSFFINIIIY
jgi:hypothetical protein